MEDSHVMHHQLSDQQDVHLLAVFDGHRGAQTAQFAAQNIATVLAELLQTQQAAVALSSSFISLDESFRSGTMLCCIIHLSQVQAFPMAIASLAGASS